MDKKTFIFDFDSTFIQCESFDVLTKVCVDSAPNADAIQETGHALTEAAMTGRMSYQESLQQRIELLDISSEALTQTITLLKNKITPSFLRNKAFFEENADDIYIISGAFVEIVWPIVATFGLKREQVFGNRLLYDFEGNIKGYDRYYPLAQDQGKVKLVHQLGLKGDLTIIGDGYNDYELKEAELAKTFIAFTENVRREPVIEMADAVIDSLEGFFITCSINFKAKPQTIKRVLLLENIHPNVTQYFESQGYEVETKPQALSEADLIKALPGVTVLGIRSKTQLNAKVLSAANDLEAIGAFCIGTNQIDLTACIQQGIAVFNAPYSNTRSVVELALAEMILLNRRVFPLAQKLRQGEWCKSSAGAHEIRGKTLGLIGYGHIGSQLSIVAEALGMQVLFYDIADKLPLGNAKPCDSLEQLLENADIISLHMDGREDNHAIINKAAFDRMKPGTIFLNLSRDFLVDEKALLEAMQDKRLGGLALDVYPNEPLKSKSTFKTPFTAFENTLLTPHIGGSTEEAQSHIGQYVAQHLMDYLSMGHTMGSVNFPQMLLPSTPFSERVIHIHKNVPGILAEINACFSKLNINIVGQLLKTNEAVGFVITDFSQELSKADIKHLEEIPNTLCVRCIK